MPTTRLEAFSDGVLAIIITIMVLGLKTPQGDTFASFVNSTGMALISYLLSFIYIGIYWNNHHHLLHAANTITGSSLWANLHLLFWLSLLPLATTWMNEANFHRIPVLCYGVVLLASAIAYMTLQYTLLRGQKELSPLAKALTSGSPATDRKNRLSLTLYISGILLAAATEKIIPGNIGSWLALACYVTVAALWITPDQRIETILDQEPKISP